MISTKRGRTKRVENEVDIRCRRNDTRPFVKRSKTFSPLDKYSVSDVNKTLW